MNDPGILVPIFGIACGLAAIIGKSFIRPFLSYKERALELQSQMAAEKAAQYAAHVERLEQRVRVLERIVTDQGAGLSSEIEALRDLPPPIN